MASIAKDNYTQDFKDLTQFFKFIGEVESKTAWSTAPVGVLRFTDLERPLDEVLELAEDYLCDATVLCDTMKNSKLVLSTGEKYIPMRSTAIRSAYERVKIGGSALSRLCKSKLADILSDCAKVASGNARILTVADKVSAVLGSDYVILPIPEVFKASEAYLSQFENAKFLEGYFCHDYTTGLWELPSISGEALIRYKDALIKLGEEYVELIPVLRVVTSNTGVSGANLYPSIRRLNQSVNMRLCPEIKLNHKGEASIEKFIENLNGVFNRLTDSMDRLTKLAETEVQHPINVMTGIYKRIGAPKRYAVQVIEKYRELLEDEPYSAHKLYFDMFDIVQYMKANPKEKDLCGKEIQLEEILGKIPFLDFDDFDFPGVVAW